MPIEVIDPSGELGLLDVPMVKRKRRQDGTVSLLGVEDEGNDTPSDAPTLDDGKERVSFTKDPVTGEIVFEDGTRVKPAMSGEDQESAKDTESGRAAFSFARSRMEARRKAKEAAGIKTIVPVEIEGETWFVKRLAASEILSIPFYVESRGGEFIDLLDFEPGDNDDDRYALNAAMLYVTCVSGENDLTPAFGSVAEVWELLDEEGDGALVMNLLSGILDANPGLLKNLTGG